MRGVIYTSKGYLVKTFPTMRGAKIALARAQNSRGLIRNIPASQMSVTDEDTFYHTIDRKVVKRNLMSGEEFVDSVNTPPCCDPSTETYWSM